MKREEYTHKTQRKNHGIYEAQRKAPEKSREISWTFIE